MIAWDACWRRSWSQAPNLPCPPKQTFVEKGLKMFALRLLRHCAAAALFAAVLCPPVSAYAQGQAYACSDKAKLARLSAPLFHMARRVAAGQPLTIVALGSSSKIGAGAGRPAPAYQSSLAVELKQRFPSQDITVLNRGVNGDETENMMARFATGVIAEHPQLVLWQVGTN